MPCLLTYHSATEGKQSTDASSKHSQEDDLKP